jgi:predicted nucleotidyltransferase
VRGRIQHHLRCHLDKPRPRAKLCCMTRTDIITRIKLNEAAIRAEGVEHLALFGSRARGDAHANSDLDVLLTVTPGCRFSLLNLSGVGLLIEDITGLNAQVVLERSVDTAFKARIADDLQPIF